MFSDWEGNRGSGRKQWQPTAGYMTVTCELTAYDRDQLRAQRSYRVWATFTFTFSLSFINDINIQYTTC